MIRASGRVTLETKNLPLTILFKCCEGNFTLGLQPTELEPAQERNFQRRFTALAKAPTVHGRLRNQLSLAWATFLVFDPVALGPSVLPVRGPEIPDFGRPPRRTGRRCNAQTTWKIKLARAGPAPRVRALHLRRIFPHCPINLKDLPKFNTLFARDPL